MRGFAIVCMVLAILACASVAAAVEVSVNVGGAPVAYSTPAVVPVPVAPVVVVPTVPMYRVWAPAPVVVVPRVRVAVAPSHGYYYNHTVRRLGLFGLRGQTETWAHSGYGK